MEKKISTKTFVLLFTISIGLICLGIGSSYAIFTASDEITNPIVFTGLSYDSDVIETVNVNVPAEETVSTTLNIANDSGIKLNYVVWYLDEGADIDLGTSSGSTSSSLANGSSTSVIVDIRNNSDESVTVQIGVMSDNDAIVLDSDMETVPNEELSMKINLIEHITNLYVDNYDSTYNTTFADGNGMNYYAPTVRLMNDGLDSAGAIVSSSSAVNGTAGNIRYYGTNDSDLKNYIYFNCSNYSNQTETTCEKWRIVGIVDGKVKIMRNEVLGNYSWDFTSSGEYDNNWSDATLMNLLNETYYNSGTITYYNESTTGTEVSFASNGITAATRNNNIISESNWYTNGYNNWSIYSNTAYANERTGNSIWPGGIALLYPSDYGYAVDINSCESTFFSYDGCSSYNWMYNILTDSGTIVGHFLSPYSDLSTVAWFVHSTGYVGAAYLSKVNGVLPTLYLNPELTIEVEGDGSNNTPYKLCIN